MPSCDKCGATDTTIHETGRKFSATDDPGEWYSQMCGRCLANDDKHRSIGEL